jgi:hypothetical protein
VAVSKANICGFRNADATPSGSAYSWRIVGEEELFGEDKILMR